MSKNIEFKIATSQAELSSCINLRYKVFVEELGFHLSGVCHNTQTLTDEWDQGAVILCALKKGRAIATCRFNYLGLDQHPHAETFHLKKQRPGTFALGSRIAIDPGFRNGILFQRFMRFLFNYLLKEGVQKSFFVCQEHLLPLYEKFGYRVLGPAVTEKNAGLVYPLMLEHFDRAHLEATRSPFLLELNRYIQLQTVMGAAS